MHTAIENIEPKHLQAGDSWAWDKALSAHLPSDGWSLRYVLRRTPDPPIATINATAVGDHFEIRVPGTTTQAYPPGLYRLVGRVSKDNDRYTIYNCTLVVSPDPIEACGSFAEQMVAQLEAELLKLGSTLAANPVRSWTQGGRSEDYGGAEERQTLQQLLGFYREQVRQERGEPAIVTMEGWFGCVPRC